MDDAEIWAEYEKWQCDYYGYPSHQDQEWHVSHEQQEPGSDADHAQPPKKRAKGNAASKKEQQKQVKKTKEVAKNNTKQSKKAGKTKEKGDSKCKQSNAEVDMTDDERAYYERSISKAIKFINKIDYADLELDDVKAAIRQNLPAFGTVNLMMYYGRPAVTVRKRCGRGWTDVGYISFTSIHFPDTAHCLLLTMSVAIALQLVSC